MRRRFLLKGISPTSEEGKECLERYRELLDDAEWQKRAAKALETNHEKQLQKCRILQAVVEVWADTQTAKMQELENLIVSEGLATREELNCAAEDGSLTCDAATSTESDAEEENAHPNTNTEDQPQS